MGVRLESVTRAFGAFVAVKGLSLDVGDGEFFVFLGSSGCGKTTTLRMIAGLEAPTYGRIYIDGRDVTDLAPKDRDIAFVFQDYGLYPHLSVYENIRFPLRIRRIPGHEHRRRTEDVARRLKIDHLLGKRPTECSGGEKQRVALARALVRSPKVFLMDEPLSNLDAKLRLAMRSEIKQLVSDLGITTIYVTHDQSEAMALASRVGVMSKGEFAQIGRPLEIYDAPANRFVADFIGSPPMNFIQGGTDASGRLQIDESALGSLICGEGPGLPLFGGNRRLTVGIRPEHFEIERASASTSIVDQIEPMGQDTLLHVTAGNTHLTVTTRDRSFVVGERVRLRVAAKQTAVIDEESGRTIYVAGELKYGNQI